MPWHHVAISGWILDRMMAAGFVDFASASRSRIRPIAAVPAGTYWLQRFASVPVLET